MKLVAAIVHTAHSNTSLAEKSLALSQPTCWCLHVLIHLDASTCIHFYSKIKAWGSGLLKKTLWAWPLLLIAGYSRSIRGWINTCVCVFRSGTFALDSVCQQELMKPAGPVFSDPRISGLTPPRERSCMNRGWAALLASVALRIHTALSVFCPGKYPWVVAVGVFIFTHNPAAVTALVVGVFWLIFGRHCVHLSVVAVFWAHWKKKMCGFMCWPCWEP